MFLRPPFELGSQAAATLAKICCHQGRLPQGAPTSPVISNLICARMDREFRRLAGHQTGVRYTRYADDLTFSSPRPFPDAFVVGEQPPVPGPAIRQLVTNNWFRLNANKTRLYGPTSRRRVTGLVVNRKVNVDRRFIRRIRSILRLWRKHGLDAMQVDFVEKHDGKTRAPGRCAPSLETVVRAHCIRWSSPRSNGSRLSELVVALQTPHGSESE